MTAPLGMARTMVLGIAVLAVAPVQASVFEINADGGVTQLDAGLVARPEPVRRVKPERGAGIQRAAALRPTVEHAARRYDISPALIDAIAHTESRYRQSAVSRAGAGGIMQLMPGTARALGVQGSDASANIHGGTAYLRRLLDRYDGNMICTIAAYNAGPGVVSQARCIPPYRETVAYVAAVLDRLSTAAQ